jgi:two-component system chemotaxis sensor kinase CheA
MNADLQQQFVQDMLTESFEGLDRYDRAILALERNEADAETLNNIFRVVHTLKGTAGCLGFQHIQRVTHAGENLLDLLRAGERRVAPPIISALLRLSDALRALLQHLAAAGTDDAPLDTAPLIAELNRLGAEPAPESAAGSASLPSTEPVAPVEIASPAAPPPVDADAGWGLFDPAPAAEAPPVAAAGTPSAPPPAAKPGPAPSAPAPSAAALAATATVRVDVALLDRLMNLVGELVLSRNQLMQLASGRQVRPEAVAELSQRLNLVTTELQEGVMKTRMQPIGNVWSKFPRIVRDIARELGKEVELETVGATTELDRTIIEAIRDPLTHVIRNSIDHGVELPAVRVAAGKRPAGRIVMRAYHEGGQVNIEIGDDGAGINLARVRQKAVERNLLGPAELAALSDREALQLVFLPGFSTAEKITNVSGRGVGMDVVKTNIEKIGGSVDLQSAPGQGTALKIKIPLTLAIVPALIVRVGTERFAIPQVSLLELVRHESSGGRSACEYVYGAPVFRLRGQLLPLVFLDEQLRSRPAGAPPRVDLNIVVLQADQRSFGLVVDDVLDTEEIVVKPLGKHLKSLPMFAGATIMGDGKIALILDVFGLAQHARVLVDNSDRPRAATAAADAAAAGPRRQLLLFSLPGRERLALPLEQASRLEEIPADRIEHSGARELVQYRGRIMPLVRLDRHLSGEPPVPGSAEPLQVIVCQHGDRTVGLVVGRIRDIFEEAYELQPGSAAPGLLGSAIVQGRITDFVDAPAILRAAGFDAALAA